MLAALTLQSVPSADSVYLDLNMIFALFFVGLVERFGSDVSTYILLPFVILYMRYRHFP